MRHLENKVVTLYHYITNYKTLKTMRNYTYHSRIVTELYRDGALSRCEIITLHYDGSSEIIQMWMSTREFEEALYGNYDARRAFEAVYTELVNSGRI